MLESTVRFRSKAAAANSFSAFGVGWISVCKKVRVETSIDLSVGGKELGVRNVLSKIEVVLRTGVGNQGSLARGCLVP